MTEKKRRREIHGIIIRHSYKNEMAPIQTMINSYIQEENISKVWKKYILLERT